MKVQDTTSIIPSSLYPISLHPANISVLASGNCSAGPEGFVQILTKCAAALKIACESRFFPDQVEKTAGCKLPGVHKINVELVKIFIRRIDHAQQTAKIVATVEAKVTGIIGVIDGSQDHLSGPSAAHFCPAEVVAKASDWFEEGT